MDRKKKNMERKNSKNGTKFSEKRKNCNKN